MSEHDRRAMAERQLEEALAKAEAERSRNILEEYREAMKRAEFAQEREADEMRKNRP